MPQLACVGRTWEYFNGHNSAGDAPYATLIFDTAGNLYGTTIFGGYYEGMVFKLTPQASGEWTDYRAFI